MKNIKSGLFIAFFFCICSLLNAQTDNQTQLPEPEGGGFYSEDKWEVAKKNIKNLKNGVLLVRLSSERRKLEELDRRIANDKLDAESHKRLKKLRKEVIEDRDATNREYMEAFISKYDFSEILFFYDTASVSLKRGIKEGIFLDKELKLDPSLSLGERPYFILRSGSLKEDTSGLEGLIVMDSEFVDLSRPFPYYVRMRGLGHLLAKLLNPGKASRRSGLKLAEKLNEKLWKFHEEQG